jgi:hypothetical protein
MEIWEIWARHQFWMGPSEDILLSPLRRASFPVKSFPSLPELIPVPVVWLFESFGLINREDRPLSESANTSNNIGFLTVLHEPAGFSGGYLVTNSWGRPIEFRLTTAVQPNRVQKVLYADTLTSYICAELIGKTLLEKTNIAVQLVVTDTPAVLDLRRHQDTPVALVARAERVDPNLPSDLTSHMDTPCETLVVRNHIHCHGQFPQDAETIQEVLDRLTSNMDLAEPFQRIREAMGEARKMGVGTR